jgi:hypothetical protein
LLVEKVLQASRVVRELLVELRNCVFHFHASSLAKPVGHPLANQNFYEIFKALHAAKG